jgi:secreted trypsin-like serine protease
MNVVRVLTAAGMAHLLIVMSGCAASAEARATSSNAIIDAPTDTAHDSVVGVGNGAQAFCTGTVIGKRTVLTAGHCVAAGIHCIYVGSDTSTATKIAVEMAVRHPSFAVVNNVPTNDLAIVKLAADAKVAPAQLFRGTLDNSAEFVGPDWTWVGFGDNTFDASGRPTGFGQKRVAHFAIGHVGAGHVGTGADARDIDDSMFWYDVPGTSMCHGDSGGPAFFVKDGVEYLAGVTSFGDPSCLKDGVQARTDAAQIAAFIQPYLDEFESSQPASPDREN